MAKFITDLERGRFRKGFRVKRVEGASGVFELTWGNDGRATFAYGEPIIEGKPHVIWRRVGTHRIFEQP